MKIELLEDLHCASFWEELHSIRSFFIRLWSKWRNHEELFRYDNSKWMEPAGLSKETAYIKQKHGKACGLGY